MLFHTWPFALFFVITYSVFLALRPTRFYLHWLLIASYVFYGWWNPLFLLLIAYSTALDYFAVIRMSRGKHRKLWLWFSMLNNLLLLGFFKYANFVTDNLNAILESVAGLQNVIPEPHILLPVGISFFTFQSMSYTIDYYRGHVDREPSFIRFATFVAFFPQLVAGPIERSRELLPQFYNLKPITRTDITDGLSLFVVGLFKKVAMANYLALYVDRIYANPAGQSGSALAVATFAFAWQIYFDFSGYTDMARGIAKIMGFDLMLNFSNPYTATSIRDFWARWHISLSTWFRDYVYVPLGGNRHGNFALMRNLFLTFVISGLWHGAAWTFIIWGALHGFAAVITRPIERSHWYRDYIPRLVKQIVVFLFVCFTWIFFRAESLTDARIVLDRIFTSRWTDPAFPMLALGLVMSIWLYQLLYESRARRFVSAAPVRIAIVVAMILYLFIAPGTPDKPFIYFQF